MNLSPKRTRGLKFHVHVIAAWVTLVLPAFLSAQTQVPDQGRDAPAAWRPSFSPMNNSQSPAPNNGFSPQDGSASRNGFAPPNSTTQNNSAQNGSASRNDSATQNNRGSADRFASRSQVPAPVGASPDVRPGVTRVTRTFEKLPNSAGQIWREYDITPYTSELSNVERPEQAVVDWIVKETGTKLWFGDPFGILNADRKRVIVYHTPEIQREVKSIIDRFNRTRAQAQMFEINLMTIDNPNWRATAYPVIQPIDVRSPGIEAWLVSKENAAILQSQLSKRGDFKRHSAGRVASPDGQTFVLEKSTPVSFVQALKWTPDQIPNYQPKTETINEGYRLALSCLTSLDNRTIEAIIDCDVDKVEKLTPVKIDLPAPGGALTQLDLNVPQLVSWRLNERVRWPADQVLLISCGHVASPEAENNTARGPRVGLGMFSRFQAAKRTNALLFVEFRGPQRGATVPQAAQNSSQFQPIGRR